MKMWRKRALAVALSLSLMLGCMVCASAAGVDENRLCDLNVSDGYDLTLLDSAGNAVTSVQEDVSGTVKAVYKNVVKMKLEFTGSAAEQYVVFLLNGGSKVPGETNVRYIDQTTGSTAVEFLIYPDQLSEPGTYYVTLSDSNDYNDEVASFTVAEPPYPVGDVDQSGAMDVGDATRMLRYLAGLTTANDIVNLDVADVDGSGAADVGDVTKMLRVLAGLDSL